MKLYICFFYGGGHDDDDDGLSKRSKSIYPPEHDMGVRMAKKRTWNGQSWKGVNGNNKTGKLCSKAGRENANISQHRTKIILWCF